MVGPVILNIQITNNNIENTVITNKNDGNDVMAIINPKTNDDNTAKTYLP